MAIRIGQSQDQCAKVALTHLFRMRKVPQSGQLAGHMPACWQLKQPQNGQLGHMPACWQQ